MKFGLFLLLLGGWAGVRPVLGQTSSSASPTFQHAAVCVQELARSKTFYHTVLQLEEIPNPFNDGLHAWFSLGAGLQLHVIQHGCPPSNVKDNHLCLRVASFSDFLAHLNKEGAAYSNLEGKSKQRTLRADGVQQIYLQDPDGHWLEINDAR
ncbi:MAG TPA: VOC family protein [Hymenobacter sp.]|jgi:lactoylglutathione lyase